MTNDEIIELARQAGSIDSEDVILTVYNAFTSKEREACAKVCEEEGKLWSKAGCTDTQTFGLCATVIRARGEA